MNNSKKLLSLFIGLTILSSSASDRLASQSMLSQHYSSYRDDYCPCWHTNNYNTKCSYAILALFSTFVAGLSACTYFDTLRSLDTTHKIIKEFNEIKNGLNSLDTHDVTYLDDAQKMHTNIMAFDAKNRSTIEQWHYYVKEQEVNPYEKLWIRTFMIQWQRLQKLNTRFEKQKDNYVLEDIKATLKEIQYLSEEFYEKCLNKLEELNSTKKTSPIVAGISVAAIAAFSVMYFNQPVA